MSNKTVGRKIMRTLQTSITIDTARPQGKRLTKEYLLPSVKFAEDKMLVFFILHEKC